MPTYDYKCNACGHEFEKFQPITAAPIRKCPKCSKLAVKRLIGTGAGVIFKGSGFYQTDYRSESYRKAAEKDKAPSADKPAAEGKPADSKSKSTDSNSKSDKSTKPAKADD